MSVSTVKSPKAVPTTQEADAQLQKDIKAKAGNQTLLADLAQDASAYAKQYGKDSVEKFKAHVQWNVQQSGLNAADTASMNSFLGDSIDGFFDSKGESGKGSVKDLAEKMEQRESQMTGAEVKLDPAHTNRVSVQPLKPNGG